MFTILFRCYPELLDMNYILYLEAPSTIRYPNNNDELAENRSNDVLRMVKESKQKSDIVVCMGI